MVFGLATLLLGLPTKEPQTETEADTYIPRFISAFFTISQTMETTVSKDNYLHQQMWLPYTV